jgi:O-acetyl-ADP-ribose deacetylase (regulator of RNase III)
MERREFGGATIAIERGDITEQRVDAIVNAANSSLMGGGGVDGAIHRAGGPEILEECREIRERRGKLPAGEAVVTTAGELPCGRVIHTVGPRWHGGDSGEDETLASAYRSSLELAADEGFETVAFPAISCGAYGYPHGRAAKIAVETIAAYLEEHPDTFEEMRLVLFDEEIGETFAAALEQLEAS